ncbi:MAG: hypothetical protein HQL76_04310 [Magnetococcales bacterium]|nr:hypothetical protein [Magnetococcales bacterium]
MKHSDAFDKNTAEKGTRTFFFPTRVELLECLDDPSRATGTIRRQRPRPSGMALALKTPMPD